MFNLQALLFTYAYNILGSTEDAEDVVQDSLLRFLQLNKEKLTNEKAYLVRMVVNAAIDRKKDLNRRLKNYPGEWLPDPVFAETAEEQIQKKETLSYSLMVLLERLDSVQRAVFILKEAFDYEHGEIAEVLGISTENSRQLLSRAKKKLVISETVPMVDGRQFLDRYLAIIQKGDTERLEQLLSEDIMVVSDGGGKVSASINPIFGRKSSIAMLMGLHHKFYKTRQYELATVNRSPAILFHNDGEVISCQIYWVEGEQLKGVFVVRNPDKLKKIQKSL